MDMKDLANKAKDALPDDETLGKVGNKIREHTPDNVDVQVAKAEQWAKDHNKD